MIDPICYCRNGTGFMRGACGQIASNALIRLPMISDDFLSGQGGNLPLFIFFS